MVAANFGSVMKGWEKCISADAGSKVREQEFVDACDSGLGFTADKAGGQKARAIFSYVDWDNKGAITLEELDPEYCAKLRAESPAHKRQLLSPGAARPPSTRRSSSAAEHRSPASTTKS